MTGREANDNDAPLETIVEHDSDNGSFSTTIHNDYNGYTTSTTVASNEWADAHIAPDHANDR